MVVHKRRIQQQMRKWSSLPLHVILSLKSWFSMLMCVKICIFKCQTYHHWHTLHESTWSQTTRGEFNSGVDSEIVKLTSVVSSSNLVTLSICAKWFSPEQTQQLKNMLPDWYLAKIETFLVSQTLEVKFDV